MNTPSNETTQTWPLTRLGLKVLDVSPCLDYYTRLGLSIIRDQSAEGMVTLGVGSRELLSLRVLPEGLPRPPRTAGLYHFALLVPSDVELGSFLQHCLSQSIPLEGASDHQVSQALYLRDPEGNGIEVYADRPRESWQRRGTGIRMTTLPLNSEALLKQARPFAGFSSALRLGHMHLNVGDIQRSTAFYQNLGLQLTADIPGQASFLSWDGYHHHLGINLWEGRHVPGVEPGVSGLDFFEIERPTPSPDTLKDPDGVTVVVQNPAI